MRKCFFVIAATLILGGCAIGNKADYRQAVPAINIQTDNEILVSVVDERPYVTRGSKRPNYVGTVRGGYYNPFNATTVSGLPLASDIREAVVSGLEQSGVTAKHHRPDETGPTRDNQRVLVLRLSEWKSDTYMRTRFDHDVSAMVTNARGEILGSSHTQGSGAVENIIDAGREILSTAVGDESVIAALSGSGEAVAAPASDPAPAAASRPTGSAYDDCMARVMRISDSELRLEAMEACDAVQPD